MLQHIPIHFYQQCDGFGDDDVGIWIVVVVFQCL